jgi:hypothetical protein
VKSLRAVALAGIALLCLPPPVWTTEDRAPESGDAAAIVLIDDFESGIANWWPPDRSGTLSGVVVEETRLSATTLDHDRDRARGHPHGRGGAMRLDFRWNTAMPFLEPVAGGAGSHLIRLHVPRTIAAEPERRFGPGRALEVLVRGEDSQSRIRLLIRDGRGQLEGSRWHTVDGDGWQRIVWDFNRDPIQGWVNGDGRVDGQTFHFDSFLITMDVAGNASGGTLFFDDFRAIPASPQAEEDPKPPESAPDPIGAESDVVPSPLPDRWLRERRLQPR